MKNFTAVETASVGTKAQKAESPPNIGKTKYSEHCLSLTKPSGRGKSVKLLIFSIKIRSIGSHRA